MKNYRFVVKMNASEHSIRDLRTNECESLEGLTRAIKGDIAKGLCVELNIR